MARDEPDTSRTIAPGGRTVKMTNPTAPPKHLSPESRKLWKSVLADYELEKRHEAILCTALEALDRTRAS